jgi:hypothetical protein
MYRIVSKLVIFLLLIVILGTVTNAVINGPLLRQNTALSMDQFKGTSATAGDFQVTGLSIPFAVVYIFEVCFLALVGLLLFKGELNRFLLKRKLAKWTK